MIMDNDSPPYFLHIESCLFLFIWAMMRSILGWSFILAHHVPPLIAIRVLCTCDSQNDSCWYSLCWFCQRGFLLCICSFCVFQIILCQVPLRICRCSLVEYSHMSGNSSWISELVPVHSGKTMTYVLFSCLLQLALPYKQRRCCECVFALESFGCSFHSVRGLWNTCLLWTHRFEFCTLPH